MTDPKPGSYRPLVSARRPGGRPNTKPTYPVLVHRQMLDRWNGLRGVDRGLVPVGVADGQVREVGVVVDVSFCGDVSRVGGLDVRRAPREGDVDPSPALLSCVGLASAVPLT